MNFEVGDIVVIEWYWRREVIGRSAEIVSVHPDGHPNRDVADVVFGALTFDVTWYVLIDICGAKRCAAHPWLRRVDPLWTPSMALTQETIP
jgi:hypothetical protein